jgi:hypothetical protein
MGLSCHKLIMKVQSIAVLDIDEVSLTFSTDWMDFEQNGLGKEVKCGLMSEWISAKIY